MRINDYYSWQCDLKDLKGKRVLAVNGLKAGSEAADFLLSDGSIFEMAYYPECCASCSILEMDCTPEDFIDQEILNAEEVGGGETPAPDSEYAPESYTWTFMKFTTSKGHFTIRWYGESNGYYSETPSCVLLPADEARETLSQAEQVLLDRAEERGWR